MRVLRPTTEHADTAWSRVGVVGGRARAWKTLLLDALRRCPRPQHLPVVFSRCHHLDARADAFEPAH